MGLHVGHSAGPNPASVMERGVSLFQAGVALFAQCLRLARGACTGRRAARRTRALLVEIYEDRSLLSDLANDDRFSDAVIPAAFTPAASPQPPTASPVGITPAQIRHAYGLDQ